MSTSITQTTTSRLHLLDAVKEVRSFVATNRAALPALSGLHLHRTDGELVVTATDLDTTVRVTIPSAGADFTVLVPAKMLQDALTGMDDDGLELDVVDGRLEMKFGLLTAAVRPMRVEDFPTPPSAGDTVPLSDDDLASLRQVAPSASGHDRPGLTDLRIIRNWAITTDSYRMTVGTFTANFDTHFDATVAAKVGKWDNAEMGCDDERVWFRGLTSAGPKAHRRESIVELVTTVGEHDYPDVLQVLQRATHPGPTCTFTFGDVSQAKQVLSSIVKLAPVNAPVQVTSTPDGLTVQLVSRDLGDVHGDIEGTSVGSDQIGVGLNPRYFLAALEAVGDDVEMEFRDALKPALFRGALVDVLLMPMRLA